MNEGERDRRIDYLEFPVASPEGLVRTRDFFARVFGWEYKGWGDEYADTKSSGLASGLNALADSSAAPLPVVYVADLEAALARVQEAGAEITQPITPFPGGRRFHFKEPSGNELAAWSDHPAP